MREAKSQLNPQCPYDFHREFLVKPCALLFLALGLFQTHQKQLLGQVLKSLNLVQGWPF